jgi:hypothetical protein
MRKHAPATAKNTRVVMPGQLRPYVEPHAEPDFEMLEIEDAKRHFDDDDDPDRFWAGRLLADRKSTRIAA